MDFEKCINFHIKSEIEYLFNKIKLQNTAIRHDRFTANQSELRHVDANVILFQLFSPAFVKYFVVPSDQLPSFVLFRVNLLMLEEFLASNIDFCWAEFRNVKTLTLIKKFKTLKRTS